MSASGDDRAPTADEIRRVRRHACIVDGHNFDVIVRTGDDAPVTVICSNCGESWSVVEEMFRPLRGGTR